MDDAKATLLAALDELANAGGNVVVDEIDAAIAVLRLRDLTRHNATVAAAMRHLDCDYVDAAELRALLMLAEAVVASQAIAVELMSLDVRDIEIDGQRWANPTAQALAREARRRAFKRWRTGGA